jgi:hypothetical protein
MAEAEGSPQAQGGAAAAVDYAVVYRYLGAPFIRTQICLWPFSLMFWWIPAEKWVQQSNLAAVPSCTAVCLGGTYKQWLLGSAPTDPVPWLQHPCLMYNRRWQPSQLS